MARNALLLMANFDHSRYVQDRLEVFLSHSPAGTSLRNLVHFAQLVDTNYISKFDHGKRKNLIVSLRPRLILYKKLDAVFRRVQTSVQNLTL